MELKDYLKETRHMNGDEHFFNTDLATSVKDFAKLFDDIRKAVLEVLAEVGAPEMFVGVYAPVEWDIKKNKQVRSRYDGVVVIRCDSNLPRTEVQSKIAEAYRKWARSPKYKELRKHTKGSKTMFLYTGEELDKNKDVGKEWLSFRKQRIERAKRGA